jgi:hypothetical protein
LALTQFCPAEGKEQASLARKRWAGMSEEFNAQVTVGELLFVRDYISEHHEFAISRGMFIRSSFLFACSVCAEYQPPAEAEPDTGQQNVMWVPWKTGAGQLLPPRACKTLRRSARHITGLPGRCQLT